MNVFKNIKKRKLFVFSMLLVMIISMGYFNENSFAESLFKEESCYEKGYFCCPQGTGKGNHYFNLDNTCNDKEKCWDSCNNNLITAKEISSDSKENFFSILKYFFNKLFKKTVVGGPNQCEPNSCNPGNQKQICNQKGDSWVFCPDGSPTCYEGYGCGNCNEVNSCIVADETHKSYCIDHISHDCATETGPSTPICLLDSDNEITCVSCYPNSCNLDNQKQICNEKGVWTDCPSDKQCINGACSIPCTDDCTKGAKQCSGDGYQTCGNYDDDSCFEFGDVISCDPDRTCIDGNCIPKYVLTITKSGTGSVTSDPEGITCGTDCTETYSSGTSITLTAQASSGYTFNGWTGCDNQENPNLGNQCTITMNSARTATASFSQVVSTDQFKITLQQPEYNNQGVNLAWNYEDNNIGLPLTQGSLIKNTLTGNIVNEESSINLFDKISNFIKNIFNKKVLGNPLKQQGVYLFKIYRNNQQTDFQLIISGDESEFCQLNECNYNDHQNIIPGNTYKYYIEMSYLDGSGLTESDIVNIYVPLGLQCTRGKPLITIIPATFSGNPGSSNIYTINVKNQDSSACESSTFNVGVDQNDDDYYSSQDNGWIYNGLTNQGPFPINPGQSLDVTTLSLGSSNLVSPGSYPIKIESVNNNNEDILTRLGVNSAQFVVNQVELYCQPGQRKNETSCLKCNQQGSQYKIEDSLCNIGEICLDVGNENAYCKPLTIEIYPKNILMELGLEKEFSAYGGSNYEWGINGNNCIFTDNHELNNKRIVKASSVGDCIINLKDLKSNALTSTNIKVTDKISEEERLDSFSKDEILKFNIEKLTLELDLTEDVQGTISLNSYGANPVSNSNIENLISLSNFLDMEASKNILDKLNNVMIKIDYDKTIILSDNINEDRLKIYYYSIPNNEWVPKQTLINREGNYVSTKIDHLSLFAVFGEKLTTSRDGSSGSGGSGGGGRRDYCFEEWKCTDWGMCKNGMQRRECNDLKSCNNNYPFISKPSEVSLCNFGLTPAQIEQEVYEEEFGGEIEQEEQIEEVQEKKQTNKEILVYIIISGFLLIAIISFIFRSRIFKNDSNVENIINDLRKEGYKDNEIKQELRRKGWSEENIKSLFKKL